MEYIKEFAADGKRRQSGKTYYAVNINHPAIKEIYEEFKKSINCRYNEPPSDEERAEFELKLFRGDFYKEIAKRYEKITIFKAAAKCTE